MSFISGVALIMAYIICDIIYNYNVLWFGYAIILILCAFIIVFIVSVAIYFKKKKSIN